MKYLPKCHDCDAEMPEPIGSKQSAQNLAKFHAQSAGHDAYVVEVDQ
ncbi:hypothetical protein [Halogeometricum borinquense]|nr:hypothetical protein [Halogeometricum borinquense]